MSVCMCVEADLRHRSSLEHKDWSCADWPVSLGAPPAFAPIVYATTPGTHVLCGFRGLNSGFRGDVASTFLTELSPTPLQC